MLKRLPKQTKEVLRELLHVEKSMKEKEFGYAQEVLLKARLALREQNVPHSWICWNLSICLDYQDQLIEALEAIVEALKQEPSVPNYHNSYEIIVGRMRNAVCGGEDESSEDLIGMYERLVALDEADDLCRFNAAGLLLKTGQNQHAFEILDALCVLSPQMVQVFQLRNEIAQVLGVPTRNPSNTEKASSLADLTFTSTTKAKA